MRQAESRMTLRADRLTIRYGNRSLPRCDAQTKLRAPYGVSTQMIALALKPPLHAYLSTRIIAEPPDER
jgi:hypothetical protein